MERPAKALPEGIFIRELNRDIRERNSSEIKLPNCSFHKYAF